MRNARADDPAIAHWYSDDQFAAQLRTPQQAAVIRNRWRIIAVALAGLRADGEVRVLDAGCGDGVNLLGLREALGGHVPRARLVALDATALRAERARRLALADAVLLGSVTALPLHADAFDAVLCNHVIEHVGEPGAAMRELARVLRPGGVMIVGVPNEGCALAWLRNHVLQRSILRTTDHVNFYTERTLRHLLASAGLRVQRVFTEGFFLPHLRLLAPARANALGRALLEAGRTVFPSQAAGLIAVAVRPS
jgi:2-polyprenyl-3-methyl-5-hydroxy-6-metoxy-1,4-benzoquinol methylase